MPAAVTRHDHPGHDDAGHPCAREEWCSGRRITRDPDGVATVAPARTYQAFCVACTAAIETCLRELPPAYLLLGAELAQMPRTGEATRSPFGPRTALREDVDVLMREMAATLRAWEARTRAVARLAPPRPLPVGSTESVQEAARTLTTALGILLALQDGWMTRTYPLPAAKPGTAAATGAVAVCSRCLRRITFSTRSGTWWAASGNTGSACVHQPAASPAGPIPPDLEDVLAAAEIVRVGPDSITVMATLSGTDAGLEIISLHRRAQAILGQAAQRPDLLDGVPCRRDDCGDYALERAPAPASPSQPAMWSRCATCRDEMDHDTYALWVTQWSSWAHNAGPLVCRRCQQGRCGECAWGACTCRASGHAAA